MKPLHLLEFDLLPNMFSLSLSLSLLRPRFERGNLQEAGSDLVHLRRTLLLWTNNDFMGGTVLLPAKSRLSQQMLDTLPSNHTPPPKPNPPITGTEKRDTHTHTCPRT